MGETPFFCVRIAIVREKVYSKGRFQELHERRRPDEPRDRKQCAAVVGQSVLCGVESVFLDHKNYRTKKRDWIYRMQVSTSVLLFCDAMTNLFRGRPDLLGFWMVRISNFFNFFLVELTLLFFHYYICAMLLTPEENAALKRVKVVRAVCCVGLALVVVSQFTGLYYTFDGSNVYHRSAGYPISMIVPVVPWRWTAVCCCNTGHASAAACFWQRGLIWCCRCSRSRSRSYTTVWRWWIWPSALREGVSEKKDNLQEIPLEAVAEWIEAFEREGVYFLPDLEQKKGQLIYDVLAPQNIHALLAVPLLRDHVVTGFLGVDNPTEHVGDATLLSSIQFFVTNSLEQKKTQERLYKLCYIDMLTGLFNRNRYMEDLSGWEKTTLTEIGGIYMDLNGLKHCNDRFGHEAGDALIRRTADALNEVFPGEGYRIGGDEFVVLRCPIGQEDFADKVHQLREALVRHDVDAAIGSFWQPLVEDLPAFLREADDRMYREKERQKRSARPSV